MVHCGKSVHIRLALPLIILQRSVNAVRLSGNNVSQNSTVLHRAAITSLALALCAGFWACADPSEDEPPVKLDNNVRHGLQG